MDHALRTHIEKIVSLTDDEFAFVLSHFSSKTAGKKDYLFRAGEKVRYGYFVISGLLKMMHEDDEGNEHIVSFAMEDWWETDFQAFFNGSPASMSLQCIEDSELIAFTLEDYNHLCAGLAKMEHFLLQKAVAGNIAAQQRILSFLNANAKQRYEQLLDKYPSLFQRVPKAQLASFLGVSRETLSRLGS